MDTSELRRTTEELAATLSEATVGDLASPVDGGGDVARLLLDLVERDRATADAMTGARPSPPSLDRSELESTADEHGGGFDILYRSGAARLAEAFASESDPDRIIGVGAGQRTVGDLLARSIRNAESVERQLSRALGFDPV